MCVICIVIEQNMSIFLYCFCPCMVQCSQTKLSCTLLTDAAEAGVVCLLNFLLSRILLHPWPIDSVHCDHRYSISCGADDSTTVGWSLLNLFLKLYELYYRYFTMALCCALGYHIFPSPLTLHMAP